MILAPPRTTRTYRLFPYTSLLRSHVRNCREDDGIAEGRRTGDRVMLGGGEKEPALGIAVYKVQNHSHSAHIREIDIVYEYREKAFVDEACYRTTVRQFDG